MGEKNMYGKKIFGVIRSTFLLDSDGTILREWRNVKATGHAEKVLKELSK
jgi:peroxiredoxin Q/BCP